MLWKKFLGVQRLLSESERSGSYYEIALEQWQPVVGSAEKDIKYERGKARKQLVVRVPGQVTGAAKMRLGRGIERRSFRCLYAVTRTES